MATLNLSDQSVDFDSIVQQLQNHLATKDAWKGFLATQSGQTILEFVAAVGALNQVKLLRYHQDSFPFTALADEPVYALATMQGVRLNRKLPMSVDVTLSSPTGALSLPEFVQFEINGNKYFNRDAITIGTTPSIFAFYEGTIRQVATKGLGSDYQMYLSQEENFEVSDVDVRVQINGTSITKTQSGAWELKGVDGCRDRTSPNGRMQLDFGNDSFGSKPGVNDILLITYVVTKGLAAGATKLIGKKVKSSVFPSIEGTANSNPSGGADERDPELYKKISAPSFGTFNSAVTKQQYLNIVQAYPGVIDGVTFAQREVNPNALEWMNLIKVVVLTASAWSPTDKAEFIKYLQRSSMYAARFFLEEPQVRVSNLRMLLYCYPSSNTEQCRIDATAAVTKLFAPRPGMLGFDIYRSDIVDAVLKSNKGIEYIIIEDPPADLLVSGRAMAAPTGLYLVSISNSLLPAGTYKYALSPVLAPGQEIAPLHFASVVVPTSNMYAVQGTIPYYEGAASYKLWGRTDTSMGLIKEFPVVAGETIWGDYGTTLLSYGLPPINTAPIRYLQLGTLDVRAVYSTRSTTRSTRL